MAHLKGSLDAFVQRLFGGHIATRLRPSYFPFTEPSAEIDCQCWVCYGQDISCRVCGGHFLALRLFRVALRLHYLDALPLGFAFGLGIERALMLRHNVNDMRDITEGDVRFSRQFGMEI